MGVLKKNEAKIKQAFAHLVGQVLVMLMNLPVNIVVFRVFMSNLFPGILKHIPSSASVSDFFTYISDNQMWSYTNHAPVESVAEEYLSANPETEQLIDKYETQLAGYNATTSLVDYIALCKENCVYGGKSVSASTFDEAYYEKISVKLQIPFTDETLEYVSILWKSLARRFLLPSLTALLYRVVEGSLVITWCIPHHFAMKIRENIGGAEAEEFFREYNIMEVKLDEEVVYYDVKVRIMSIYV